MKNRIKYLRDEILNLSQTDFGKKINLNQSTIGNYENGRREIPERVIADICREYDVNEEWLRTGKEPIQKEMTEKEKLIARINEVYNSPNDFHKQALHVLAEMSPEEIKILQIMAERIIAERQNKDKT